MIRMVKGFYIVGFFDKGLRPKVDFVTQREKPFEIDTVRGEVSGRAFHVFDTRKNAPKVLFPREWFFVENCTFKDVEKDASLRKFLNELWFDWCKKYKRKPQKILID